MLQPAVGWRRGWRSVGCGAKAGAQVVFEKGLEQAGFFAVAEGERVEVVGLAELESIISLIHLPTFQIHD